MNRFTIPRTIENPSIVLKEAKELLTNEKTILSINFLLGITNDIISHIMLRPILINILTYFIIIVDFGKSQDLDILTFITTICITIFIVALIFESIFNLKNSMIIHILYDSTIIFHDDNNYNKLDKLCCSFMWTILVITTMILEITCIIFIMKWLTLDVLCNRAGYNIGNDLLTFESTHRTQIITCAILLGSSVINTGTILGTYFADYMHARKLEKERKNNDK